MPDMQQDGGGWRLDLEDRESLIAGCDDDTLLMAMSGTYGDVPDSMDYRPHLKMENQGPQGSCQGNSITTCVEKIIFQTVDQKVQLSRQFAYTESQRLRGLFGSDRGSCVEDGVTIAKRGLPLEEMWPYPNPVRYEKKPRGVGIEEVRNQATYKILKHYNLRDPQAVMEFIETDQGAVHIGIRWVSSMRGAGAYVSSYSGGGSGGHSICLIGHETVKGSRCPRLFNSHSSRYGDKGTTVVGRRALDGMFRDRHTVMIGVSGYDTPLPRHHNYKASPVSR